MVGIVRFGVILLCCQLLFFRSNSTTVVWTLQWLLFGAITTVVFFDVVVAARERSRTSTRKAPTTNSTTNTCKGINEYYKRWLTSSKSIEDGADSTGFVTSPNSNALNGVRSRAGQWIGRQSMQKSKRRLQRYDFESSTVVYHTPSSLEAFSSSWVTCGASGESTTSAACANLPALLQSRGGASTTAETSTASRSRTKKNAWVDACKNGLSSALAAACVKTTLQPLDAIKTVQQYYRQQQKTESTLSVWGASKILMSRPGGVSNFYAGLTVNVIGAMPSVALYFGVYSYCKKVLINNYVNNDAGSSNTSSTTSSTSSRRWKKVFAIALSAAIGNTVASFSRVPYEVLKQKLQTQAYASTWEALRDVATSSSWSSLIFPKGGIAIQMIRDIPYAVVTLLVYETLQASFNQQQSSSSRGDNKQIMDFVLGGTAGGLGSWFTNPMDVVKTRIQTDSATYGGSVWACTKAVYQEGGAAAFLRGSVPRLMHKVPANAFFFFFYEFFRKLFQVDQEDDN